METNDYVSYPLALSLKKAGFDEPCYFYYTRKDAPDPASVMKLEASRAVRQMKPHTVIGCYATHKWRDDTQSGNDKGVDFEDVFSKVRRLVLVGNLHTHKDNPLMALPHEEVALPGLITRAADQSLNRVFIWTK